MKIEIKQHGLMTDHYVLDNKFHSIITEFMEVLLQLNTQTQKGET